MTPPSTRWRSPCRPICSPRSRCARSISASPSSSKSRSPPISRARRRCSMPRAGAPADHRSISIFPSCRLAARQGDARGRRDRTAAPRGRDLERREPGDPPAPRELEDAWRRWWWRCSATSSAIAFIISNGFAARSRASAGGSFRCPTRDAESSIALALAFASGAGGSLQMSCASFLGSGHRIEFYGDDGTLVLANPTADYFRGFELEHARGRRCACGRRDRGCR